MDEFEKELKMDFLAEALELLANSEKAFLALEHDKTNSNLINEIFRLAHNLKGTSRAVGFSDVAEFTHEMENLILKVKEGLIEINNQVVSLLLECNDHVTIMINGLNQDLNSTYNSVEIIGKILKVLSGETEVSTFETNEVVKINEEPTISEEDLALIKNFESGMSSSDETLLVEEISTNSFSPSFLPTEAAKASSSVEHKKPQVNKFSAEDESIRVSLSKVETLNNVVGELVIIQTVLNQHRSEVQNVLMLKSLTQLAKLSKEIQDISMSLRMIPLRQTLQKMQRIVRDTSKALDKKVNLEIVGEDTEIDKTVLEHLADPLVHIIRNAVDHGLESTAGRIKAGKSEEGIISIKAFHEGTNLVIEVRDDGNGINPKIIREKAIEKNVISANSNMSDEDIINLIFHPGFSTKAEVSEVSGRGVGMDVVKTNITKLSGEVKVMTVLGKGSVFRVVLPLTLAIIEAMVTKIGDEKYLIPLSQISESLTPKPELIHHVNGVGDCLKLRGEVIPLFKISSALQRTLKEKPLIEQIAIIVNSSDKQFAILVDDILHQQQVVIKKLGREIKNQEGFMGSSILGDGRPAFILDLMAMFAGKMKKKKSTYIEDMAA